MRKAYEAGETALKASNLKAAREAFLQVLSIQPDDLGARINLGVVCMREKEWPQALQYLKEAEKRAPQITGIRLNIGLAQYRKGDYANAIGPFQSVLRDQPDSIQARHLLGLSFLFQERYGEAASTLEPLWTTTNTNLAYLYSLAVAAGNAGLHDLEEKALAQLLSVGHDSPLLHLLRGKAYLAHEDFTRALEEFESANQMDGRLPLLHYNMGVIYRRQGNTDKARLEFETDIGLEPLVAFNYDQLGAMSFALQEDKKAEYYFTQALKLDARLGTSWFGLAKIYKKEKRYSEALKALSNALAIDSQSASAHYLKSQILSETGQTQEAKTELAAVRRIKSDSRDKLEVQLERGGYRDLQIVEDKP